MPPGVWSAALRWWGYKNHSSFVLETELVIMLIKSAITHMKELLFLTHSEGECISKGKIVHFYPYL